jgi:hypothetical protein
MLSVGVVGAGALGTPERAFAGPSCEDKYICYGDDWSCGAYDWAQQCHDAWPTCGLVDQAICYKSILSNCPPGEIEDPPYALRCVFHEV